MNSVLSQEDIDLELVLVLDGIDLEPETTPWLLDPRLVVVKNSVSEGIGKALQLGMHHTRGKYIGRLDSDDVALPGRFATQVRFLDEHPDVVAVSGGATWINENDDIVGAFGHTPTSDALEKLLEQNVIVQSAVTFRREAYDQTPGYPSWRQMEDYFLWIALAHVGTLAILPEVVTNYRVHSSQTSRGVNPRDEYVNEIIRLRRELARQNGLLPGQRIRDIKWLGALYLMYYLPPSIIKKIRKATGR